MWEEGKWGRGEEDMQGMMQRKKIQRGEKRLGNLTNKGREQMQTHTGRGYSAVFACVTFHLILLGTLCHFALIGLSQQAGVML